MDVPSAVLVLLLIAQAAGGPVKRGALDESIRLIEKKRQDVLKDFNGTFKNESCNSMNITEEVGAELQSLDASPLSPFRHCIEKLVELTPELRDELYMIAQYIQHLVQPESDPAPSHDCSIPSFKEDFDKYVYVKCLLQLLGKWLDGLRRPSKVA